MNKEDIWVLEYIDVYYGHIDVSFYKNYDNALTDFYINVSDLMCGEDDCDINECHIESSAFGCPESKEYYLSDNQYVQLYKMSAYPSTDSKLDDSMFVKSSNIYTLKDDRITIRYESKGIETSTIKWLCNHNEFRVYSDADYEWKIPLSECKIVSDEPYLIERFNEEIRSIAAEKILE